MATDPFTDVGAEFAQVSQELDFASRRLEAAFSATSAPATHAGDVDADNLPQPVDLVRRLRAMEAELPMLLEKLTLLAKRKQVRRCCTQTVGRGVFNSASSDVWCSVTPRQASTSSLHFSLRCSAGPPRWHKVLACLQVGRRSCCSSRVVMHGGRSVNSCARADGGAEPALAEFSSAVNGMTSCREETPAPQAPAPQAARAASPNPPPLPAAANSAARAAAGGGGRKVRRRSVSGAPAPRNRRPGSAPTTPKRGSTAKPQKKARAAGIVEMEWYAAALWCKTLAALTCCCVLTSDEDVFNGVPSLTRGRCKFKDVSKVRVFAPPAALLAGC